MSPFFTGNILRNFFFFAFYSTTRTVPSSWATTDINDDGCELLRREQRRQRRPASTKNRSPSPLFLCSFCLRKKRRRPGVNACGGCVCVCVERSRSTSLYWYHTASSFPPFIHIYSKISVLCVQYIVPYANTTRTHIEGPTYSYWVESYPINLSRISLA